MSRSLHDQKIEHRIRGEVVGVEIAAVAIKWHKWRAVTSQRGKRKEGSDV
jgi:hypothetical protein